jgi:hypothetical protein
MPALTISGPKDFARILPSIERAMATALLFCIVVDFPVSGGGALALRPSAFVGASADLLETRAELAELVASYGMIAVSTHILFARGDALLDYRLHGERTEREIRGARLTLIEGGHMLPFTRPRQIAAWIRKSINGALAAP